MKKYSFADEPKLLKRVTVRLMLDSEKPRFDLLLETKHYLASAHMAGQTLRYVAELDGEWVAIASFSAAVTVMMGANGYKAMEDACQKFTQRQLKALGSKRQADGKYRAPSSSTFFEF